MNLNALYRQLPKDSMLLVSKEGNWVTVAKMDQQGYLHTTQIYKVVNQNGTLQKVRFSEFTKSIKDAIMSKVDSEALIRSILDDKLTHIDPNELIDIKERLENQNASVTVKPDDCVSILIGGKKGYPMGLQVS